MSSEPQISPTIVFYTLPPYLTTRIEKKSIRTQISAQKSQICAGVTTRQHITRKNIPKLIEYCLFITKK